MPEGEQAVGDTDQAGPLQLLQHVRTGPERRPGCGDARDLAGVVGGGDQQQTAGGLGQPVGPVQEHPLQGLGHRQPTGQGGSAGELSGGEHPGEFQQGERVAARAGQQLGTHLRAHIAAGRLPEDLPGGGQVEAAEGKIGQVVGVEAAYVAFAGGEQQHHGLLVESAGHEGERRCRGLVQPLCVVDHGEYRLLVGRFGEQAEGAEEDQEPIRHGPALLAERSPDSRCLRRRDLIELAEQWPQQPVQGSEGQRRLGLNPAGPHQADLVRGVDRLAQQRRLAGPRRPTDHQRAAGAPARPVDQLGDAAELTLPPVQHPQSVRPRQSWPFCRCPGRR